MSFFCFLFFYGVLAFAENDIIYDERAIHIKNIMDRLDLSEARTALEQQTARVAIIEKSTLSSAEIRTMSTGHSYDWLFLPNLQSIGAEEFRLLLQLDIQRGLVLPIEDLPSMIDCTPNSIYRQKRNIFLLGKQSIPDTLSQCYPNARFVAEEIIQTSASPSNMKYLFLSEELNPKSLSSLRDYRGKVIIRGDRFPTWLEQNTETLQWSSLLFLDLQQISTKQMASLSAFAGSTIVFSALNDLNPSTARTLNRLENLRSISLPKLQPTDRTLSILARNAHANTISLGIREPSPKQIAAFSKSKPTLLFPNVRSLPTESIDALVRLMDKQKINGPPLRLQFPRLEMLSAEATDRLLHALLKKSKEHDYFYHEIKFNIPQLDADVLQVIVDFASPPHRSKRHWSQDLDTLFNTARSISPEAIEWRIATPNQYRSRIHPRYICDRTVEQISQIDVPTAQKILSVCDGQELEFAQQTSIRPDVLAILLTHNNGLVLSAVETLSPAQAQQIAASTLPSLALPKLRFIETAALEQLAQFNGVLRLPRSFLQHPKVFSALFPKHVSTQSALHFSSPPASALEMIATLDPKTYPSITLTNQLDFSPETAAYVARFTGQKITLQGLMWQSSSAEKLASFAGREISIDQFGDQPLETLGPLKDFRGEQIRIWNILQGTQEGLRAISQFQVPTLDLIFERSDIDLRPLAAYQGTLKITGVNSSARLEVLIGEFQGKTLEIDAIDRLTPTVVESISKSKAKISIRSTESIDTESIDVIRNHPQIQFFITDESFTLCQLDNIVSEVCEMQKEMEESLEYWENHDCGEEEHEH